MGDRPRVALIKTNCCFRNGSGISKGVAVTSKKSGPGEGVDKNHCWVRGGGWGFAPTKTCFQVSAEVFVMPRALFVANPWTPRSEYAKALDNYSQALEIQKRVLGDHPDTAATLQNIGTVHLERPGSVDLGSCDKPGCLALGRSMLSQGRK